MPGERILLVEDDFLIRLIAAEALLEAGYPVVEAAGGEEAVRILEDRDDLDLLVTDLQMPGSLDGISVARRARTLIPSMPIVFATARPDSIRAFAERSARDAIVQKPYGPAQLLEVIRRCLE